MLIQLRFCLQFLFEWFWWPHSLLIAPTETSCPFLVSVLFLVKPWTKTMPNFWLIYWLNYCLGPCSRSVYPNIPTQRRFRSGGNFHSSGNSQGPRSSTDAHWRKLFWAVSVSLTKPCGSLWLVPLAREMDTDWWSVYLFEMCIDWTCAVQV